MFFNLISMGLDDRDYMKDSGDDVLDLGQLLTSAAKIIVIVVACVFCLRFPVLWIKIPLICIILFSGWRWIFRAKKKKKARPGLATAITTEPRPVLTSTSSTGTDQNAVETLIVLDAAGEFGQAKTLIQRLDGVELSKEEGEELAGLAKNYFPVSLEPTENGVRFHLT